MAVEWIESSMGTGIDSVDEQHQQLIGKLNRLAAALRSGKEREEIGKMLEFLGNYTVEHFEHEEKCMDVYGCAAAARNKKEHAKFLALFAALKEDFESSGPSKALALEIEAKLMAWLVFHIKGTDRQLYGYTRAMGELDIT